jgi:hypothetical protein
MFGALIMVLRADRVAGYSLIISERQIPLVVSARVLNQRVRGGSGD